MKSKTVAGKTRPEPTQRDCDLLDHAIDLVLLYEQYECDEALAAAAERTADGLRDIAKRCNELLKATPEPPDAAEGKPGQGSGKPK